MELRQLAVFVAIAEEGSITRAAERRNVVQSAVSSTLRTLERELGVELVYRTTHQVELTDAGRLFLPEARRTLAAAQEAQYVLQQAHDGLRGTLRLGILLFDAILPVTPPALISRFVHRHPGMDVVIRTGASGDHVQALRRGQLDLAFVGLPSEQAAGLTLHPVHIEPMSLVVPPGHRFADRQRIELTELTDEPFVETTSTWGTRIANDLAFLRAGVRRTIRYEVADNHNVHDFVRHGLGISVSPVAMVDPDLRIIPIGRYAPKFVLSLAAADRDLSIPAQEMLKIVEQLLRESSAAARDGSGARSGKSRRPPAAES
jgi:DNA-binding transcriptional LysR family regulator